MRSLLLALGVLLVPVNARAQDAQNKTCVEAHRDAQKLRKEEKLLEARSRMVVCAGATCPGLVQEDCTKWLDEVGKTIPSVVVSAKDEGGHELRDVSVTVKDKLPARPVDGTPLELDPGAYVFRYERPGKPAIERDVVLQTGVRNRLVEVEFPGGKPAPKQKPKPPVITWILAGTGVVALGSFSYFGLKGRSEYNHLKDSCGTRCEPGSGDDARRNFLIADISLGVAAVSLAGAAYFYFIYTPKQSSESEMAKLPKIRLGATNRGGFASYATEF